MLGKKKTVASIVSGLSTMLTDLEEVQTTSNAEIKKADEKISALEKEKKGHEKEKSDAQAIAANLSMLLNKGKETTTQQTEGEQ